MRVPMGQSSGKLWSAVTASLDVKKVPMPTVLSEDDELAALAPGGHISASAGSVAITKQAAATSSCTSGWIK